MTKLSACPERRMIMDYPSEEGVELVRAHVKDAVAKKQRELDIVEAMLYALVTQQIENDGIVKFFNDAQEYVDWNKAGVTFAEFEKWWEEYESRESLRRTKERAEALKKLTPRERAILGLY